MGIASREPAMKLIGAHGSPYSRKMRSVLRYRRIPFEFVVRGAPESRAIPNVPVALIPVLVFPGLEGAEPSAMIDSTFQIRRLEERVTERSLIPPDPALAFIDALLEDYADEWLTKAMFHYRWSYEADIQKAATLLPRWSRIDASEQRVAALAEQFSKRQIERLAVVGSNDVTAPVIEESYRRLLRTLDACIAERPFVLGKRPGAADFALFGQLTQLALFDPTPAAIALEEVPRVVAWCHLVEDLSGLLVGPEDWVSRDAVPASLRALLAEVGRGHAVFLLANERALRSSEEQVECTIDGHRWAQRTFPYQGKCLRWLREQYGALRPDDRCAVDSILKGSGCEALF